MFQQARRFREAGNESEFLKTALAAFRRRPHRGEPLHDLSRHYFHASRGDISVIYADAGIALPIPADDGLGVEPEVYQSSLKEAFVMAASYSKDPAEKHRGRLICNWLMLSRDVPVGVRSLARLNYHWFIELALSIMPSIRFLPVQTDAPDGFKPGNISITRAGDGFVALIRAVNYDQLESGFFDRHGDTSFRQRTMLLRLEKYLHVWSSTEVFAPERPAAGIAR